MLVVVASCGGCFLWWLMWCDFSGLRWICGLCFMLFGDCLLFW